MRLLIIGGTQFLGRHLTEAALAAGWQVTLFNRGQTNARIFPQIERITGDRDSQLDRLAGRRWDAAVDTCGYIPRHVREAAQMLADAVEHYTLISSISVYQDKTPAGSDENGPLQTLVDETVEEVTGETYGGLKVLCERAAEDAMPGRVLHVRSGLIVGPYDPTDRFTYWPVRVSMGGEVLAPGKPAGAVQFIDGRDQAAWIVRMIAARRVGVFNVTGPAEPLTMGRLLESCREVTGSDARLTWVDETFLLEQGVTPFTELPCWIPEANNSLQKISIQRALEAGLTFRPLEETIADTLAWTGARAADPLKGQKPRAGMLLEREAELLAAWRARRD